MDHAISYLIEYMQMDKDEFIEEWKSGNYNKITDCPSYGNVKTYCNAINDMAKYCYGEKYVNTPIEIIRDIK